MRDCSARAGLCRRDAVALDQRRHGERGRRDGDLHRLAQRRPDAAAVDVTTSNGSATAPADDAHKTERLDIPAGGTKPFVVSIPNDASHEDDKSFSVTLSNPAAAVIGDGTGTGTITDDDGPPPISIGDVTVTEGNSGTVDANFVVSVSPVSGKPITVQYSTGTGTATAGSDYVAAQDQTLTIPAGQPSGTITIKINGDELAESSESFPVNLFNATNATISDGSGAATITDNDAAPVASIEDFTTREGDANLNVDVTVKLAGPGQQTMTFDTGTSTLRVGCGLRPPRWRGHLHRGRDRADGSTRHQGDVLDEPAEAFLIQIVRPADGAICRHGHGDDHRQRQQVDALDRRCGGERG